jgi:hypothetical protein
MTTVPADSGLDIASLIPNARRIHPVELEAGDLLFDTSGALHAVEQAATYRNGTVVATTLSNGHRVWFWNDEPIIAVLPRTVVPSIITYRRVFDPGDEAGWANGDPRTIDSESEQVTWEPDDGDPIRWAVDILNRNGTLEPSSSPPFTERTWYSGTGVDFARSGATVDTSAHLSGFTLAEIEQIGARVTAPPARRPLAIKRGALSRRPESVSRALPRSVEVRGR